jgi:adenylate kinase
MSGNTNSRKSPPLILLGAPGAGKGTQARVISQALGIPHIGTGAIFRQHVQQGTPLGQLARGYMQKGELVPDDVVNKMVRDRLGEPDCAHGFLLDGYPRTVVQAREFRRIVQEMGQATPVVVLIQVSYDEIVKRLSGRWNCPTCQRTYNLHTQPPLRDRVCDNDGAPLEQRVDDSEAAIRERLAAYERQTAPLVDFYRDGEGGVLEINGEKAPEEISSELKRVLQPV